MKHRHNWKFLRYAISDPGYWSVDECECGLLRYITGMGQYKVIRFLMPGQCLRGGRDIMVGFEQAISLKQKAKDGYLAQNKS